MYKYIPYIFLITVILTAGCAEDKNLQKINNDTLPGDVNLQNQQQDKKTEYKVKSIGNEDITITTSDKIELSAKYFYDSALKDSAAPLVILIHQFKQSKEQWSLDFITALLNKGYKVLAFDIRGHGKSGSLTGNKDLEILLSDPEEAPKDIEAVVKWAKNKQGIDSSSIAVIGTSVGGNMALYAKFKNLVKTVISVSNGKETFESFTGYNEAMLGRPYFEKVSSVLLISGKDDGGCAAGQKWVYENFLEAQMDLKIYESGKHGKALIEEKPEINNLIIDWLTKNL